MIKPTENKVIKATKLITFVVKNPKGRGLVLDSQEVDLEKLTGLARVLADLIYTTENADDFSKVRIISPKTNEELYREDGKPEEEIRLIRKEFGEEILNTYPSIIWWWDLKRKYETPEEYFIRHSKSMKKLGGTIVGTLHNELEQPINLSI